MPKVGIVCDSTADLDPGWYASNDVEMVPLKVMFGDTTYLDWTDLRPAEFLGKLKAASALPKTSQPSPAEFESAYAKLAEKGVEGIVSVHLTSALSGTYASAIIAADTSPVPVRVVDTRLVSQATGLVVKAAVEARNAGSDVDGVESAAIKTSASTRLFFVLDTLDYLVKGGRAGKAAGLAASLLDIKPILTFNAEGTIEPFKKVKGRKKAFTELAEEVARASAAGRIKMTLLHASAQAIVDELKAAIDAAGADYESDGAGLIGAVIGTYAGPEAVGVAFHPIG